MPGLTPQPQPLQRGPAGGSGGGRRARPAPRRAQQANWAWDSSLQRRAKVRSRWISLFEVARDGCREAVGLGAAATPRALPPPPQTPAERSLTDSDDEEEEIDDVPSPSSAAWTRGGSAGPSHRGNGAPAQPTRYPPQRAPQRARPQQPRRREASIDPIDGSEALPSFEEPEGAERDPHGQIRRDPVIERAIKATTSKDQLELVVKAYWSRLNYQEVVLAINHLCYMHIPAEMTVRTWSAMQVRELAQRRD
jgi:hypothetical protein